MKSISIKAFAVYTNSDLNAGGGREFVKARFTKEEDAIKAGYKGYVQGLNCPVKEETVTVEVFESYEEYNNPKITKAVQDKKLTREEIEFIKNNL